MQCSIIVILDNLKKYNRIAVEKKNNCIHRVVVVDVVVVWIIMPWWQEEDGAEYRPFFPGRKRDDNGVGGCRVAYMRERERIRYIPYIYAHKSIFFVVENATSSMS